MDINNPLKKLVIDSDYAELQNVENFVKNMFKEKGIPNEYFNKVYLCISEAVINSIEHGNKHNKNKKVSIVLDFKERLIEVKIKDEGKGFNIKGIESPVKTENIKKESGRGIHIIKSLSKQIEYIPEEKCIQFKIECK